MKKTNRDNGYRHQAAAMLKTTNIRNVQSMYWIRRFVVRRASEPTAMEISAAKISIAVK